jgi:hypothetical protein
MKRNERPNTSDDMVESPNKLKDASRPRAEYPDLVFEDPYEDSFESESMDEGSEHESEEDNGMEGVEGIDMEEEDDEEKKEVASFIEISLKRRFGSLLCVPYKKERLWSTTPAHTTWYTSYLRSGLA